MDQGQPNYQQSNSTGYYIPPKKHHNFISIILIIVVLLCAMGLYFAMKDRLSGSTISKESAITDNTKNIDLSSFSTPIHYELKVYGPDGKELTELYHKSDLDASKLNLSSVNMNFQLPDKYPAGEYLAKARIYDDKGNERNIEQKVTETDDIKLSNLSFRMKFVDKDNVYLVQPDATYPKSDLVIITFGVHDLSEQKVGNKYHTSYQINIKTLDSNGYQIDNLTRSNMLHADSLNESLTVLYGNTLQLNTYYLDSGKYTVIVEAVDLLSGKKDEIKGNFYLK